MKFFIFAGSARKNSLNRKLAVALGKRLESMSHSANVKSLADYEMPLYHGDLEAENGLPEKTSAMKAAMSEADAIIMVSPEYNGSIPGPLKNAIDWISRPDKAFSGEHPFANRHYALLSASPGYFGGIRMQTHLRDVLCQLGANVYGKSMAIPSAGNLFAEDGSLTDEKTMEKIDGLLEGFVEFAG